MSSKKQNIYSILVIFSIAIISYFNSFEISFHYDDDSYILKNEAFKEYIERPYSFKDALSHLSNRSIVLATLYFNYSISGFEVFGFHLFNLVVHLLTCLLVFILSKELLEIVPFSFSKNNEGSGYKINIPLTGAILFAVHPMNTQAVTYITGRSSLLATCFYIASFLFFIKGSRKYLPANLPFYIFSFIFFIGGYGSKSIVITAPIMFIVFTLFYASSKKNFLDNRPAKIIIAATVFLSPFILILLSRIINLKYIVGLDLSSYPKLIQQIKDKLFFIVSLSERTISSSTYMLTEFKAMIFYYVRMILLPFNQNIDPNFPITSRIMDISLLFSLFVIILLLFAGITLRKRSRLLSFGIFWFFITLLPTSSFLPLQDAVVEHRLYLPLSVSILIIPLVMQNLSHNARFLAGNRAFIFFFIFFLATMFSALTAKRNFAWMNEKSLWSDAAKKSPKLSRPFNNLGEAYDKDGEYKKAIEAFNKAIANSPNSYKPYNNLGKLYGKLKRLDLAEENLKKAIQLKPDYTIGRYNLAKIYELKGNLNQAIIEYSVALKQKYDFFEACFNLANAYSKINEYSKAIETYTKCARFRPSFPKLYLGIGDAYLRSGDIDKSFEYVYKALELNRDYLRAKMTLAKLFIIKTNFEEAEKIYRQVIDADPDNYGAHNSLGMLFFQHLGKNDKAVFHFKKSYEINPNQRNGPFLKTMIRAYGKN